MFFTDADFGPTEDCDVVRTLRAAGLTVEPHHSHFPERTPDHVWLAACAENGWIPVTKDNQISYSPLAKAVIMERGVQLFVCIGEWPHVRLAQNFVHTLARVESLVTRVEQPFIARVYMVSDDDRFKRGKSGEVKQWLTLEEWKRQQRR